MTSDLPDDLPEVPEWFLRDVLASPEPSPEDLEKYSFFTKGLSQHLRQIASEAAPSPSLAGTIQAVFSTAGKLLEKAAEGMGEILAPPQVAFGTRGASATKGPAAELSPMNAPFLSGITIPAQAGATVCLQWLRRDEGPVIELSVVDSTGSPIRPLDISVADESGTEITEPVHVDPTAISPQFPQPSPGIYVFDVIWPAGEQQVRIEVRAS